MRRHSRRTPARSEIALVATTALTSATMLFACLVVPFTAVAGPLRASDAPAASAGCVGDGAASRPAAPRALAHIAKAGTGEQPTPSPISASARTGDTDSSSVTATEHGTLTPSEPRGRSLARGQPGTDAVT